MLGSYRYSFSSHSHTIRKTSKLPVITYLLYTYSNFFPINLNIWEYLHETFEAFSNVTIGKVQ